MLYIKTLLCIQIDMVPVYTLMLNVITPEVSHIMLHDMNKSQKLMISVRHKIMIISRYTAPTL